jgi:hypothetical protein
MLKFKLIKARDKKIFHGDRFHNGQKKNEINAFDYTYLIKI